MPVVDLRDVTLCESGRDITCESWRIVNCLRRIDSVWVYWTWMRRRGGGWIFLEQPIIIYAMRQRTWADNFTICYHKKQIYVSFWCVRVVIDNEFCHNIVRVVCRSTLFLPCRSTATLTMLHVWRNSWSITEQAHEKLTSICYHRFCCYATLENKTPVETFSKFLSVLRVIDRLDRNPPISAR